MVGKPLPSKPHPPGNDAGNARFLHELEALGKALSLDPKPKPKPKPRHSLPPPPSRSLSTSRSHDPKPKPKDPKDKKPSSSSSSSFWTSWKPLKALSHIRDRRFDCRFTFHVHSIDALPAALADASFIVHWKRTTDSNAAATRPARAFFGAVEFEETLGYRCSVYGRSGANNVAKYEARHFLIWVSVVGSKSVDLGRNLVDLTRLLPLRLEEIEDEEKQTGRWSTSYKLSEKARGATLNVSFGFSIVDSSGGKKKVLENLGMMPGRVDRGGGLSRSRDRSRSVENVKVLHEVLPSTRSEVSGVASAAMGWEHQEDDSMPEFEAVVQQDHSPDLKCCTLLEPIEGIAEKGLDEVTEFMVTEQGIEMAIEDKLCESGWGKAELGTSDEPLDVISCRQDGLGESSVLPSDPAMEDVDSALPRDPAMEDEDSALPREPAMEDVDSTLNGLSILELEGVESPHPKDNTRKEEGFSEFRSICKPGSMMSRSLSLDDDTDSIANEFLSMLGIEHSPLGLSSDSDKESPRNLLWKQFEKESLATGDSIFGFDIEAGEDSDWGGFSEDHDLSSIVLEAETELQKAAQDMDSKSRAKMLEDAETEALMHEWGLDEKAFRSSPPGSSSGFGSPIHLHPEEPLELPPLAEGLGPFLQTKDGGFMRSMNPSLFKSAKNNGSLIMQVSSPVVVPAEMGSGIMDILQRLASVGIEKLSMQAKKLMPLEDISGRTMQQAAWEAAPSLEAYERQEQHPDLDVDSGMGQNASSRKKKKGKSSNLASLSGGETDLEYVSIEDLAPLAMDKIEALSIEGLKIQSGMSDEEASTNINAQSIGDISAFEGKEANNIRSLGLEGAAGLQLLDVKDNGNDIDGLMGLSITLDEWMRLDSGIIDEEDQISDRTSKILAAHHACSTDFVRGGRKGDKGGKRSGKRWGLLGNNFTVALMVQLRDPTRDYEPVGTPMLALIQVERVFVPPKPKIYSTVSEKGNNEQDDEPEIDIDLSSKEEKKEEGDVVPQFKITEVHVAGLKTEPDKKKIWGNPKQQQAGSRWLLASGMGKGNKHSFMKSNSVVKPSQGTAGDSLWSISSRISGIGAKLKELGELNSRRRNPNVILPNETIRLH